MTEPLKCCPHCDAEQEFSHMHGELTPCWLCRKPLDSRAASARPRIATPKPPPPVPLLETIVRTTALTLAVIIGIPIAATIALFAVCTVAGIGMLGLSAILQLFTR